MLKINWELELSQAPDVQTKWNIFKSKMNKAIDECVPKINIQNSLSHAVPLDKSNREKIKYKNKLWKRYITTGNPNI